MELRLSEDVEVSEFKVGIAIFDVFRNDTHFIHAPFSTLINHLQRRSLNHQQLLQILRKSLPEVSEKAAQGRLEEFLEHAKKLHLLDKRCL